MLLTCAFSTYSPLSVVDAGQRTSTSPAEALLEFQSNLNLTDTTKWRWNEDTEPCAQKGSKTESWRYVICSANSTVAGLNFSDVNLRGQCSSG